jgi:hypothetical protein
MLRPPKGGTWLEVDEIIKRLRAEFSKVTVIAGPTADYARQLALDYRADGHVDLAHRIEAVKDQGAWIEVVDGNPAITQALPALPGVPIMAGFQSLTDLAAMQPLLKRCAFALGYELL